MLELYQLRYFLAVVETGSFTQAAKRVRVSQPSLSAGIQKLEAVLGVPLFDRSRKRVFLTAQGSRFVEHARAILSQCQRAEREVTEVKSPDVLRLGVLMTIPTRLVSKLVRDYNRAQSDAVIELFEGTEQELHNRLDAGQVDVALTVVRSAHRSRAEPLYREPYLLALPAEHSLATRTHVRVTELAREPIIVRTRCEVLSESSRFFTDHNVRPRLVYRTEQDERALAMVGAGLGVTVMPAHYRAADVRRVPLVGFDLERNVGLLHPPGHRKQATTPTVARLSRFAASQAWGDSAEAS